VQQRNETSKQDASRDVQVPVQSDSSQPDVVPLEIAPADQSQSESALALLTAVARSFAKDLRRVLPFLARQRGRTAVDTARSGHDPELRALTDGPSYLVRMSSSQGVWVALQFDSAAITALLQGLFGTPKPDAEEQDGAAEPAEEEPPGSGLGDALTLAQRALLKRLCGDLSALARQPTNELCKVALGEAEFVGFKRGESAELGDDGIAVDCNIENVRRPWAVRIWMGAEALERLASKEAAATSAAPAFGAAALRIPVSVVAELGRVTLKLSQVLGLRVGDTLRLPSPANDPVLVRVEGVAKFDAVPVISRGQVAVKIHARHQE
jgi:flagellar motor switch/type III secretory pathway protein FliN